MEKNIFIIGAFDRFNYGDLLFPLIIKEQLIKNCEEELNFRYYGIINSDLRFKGGVKTLSIRELIKDGNNYNDIILIVAGGEVLNAKWSIIKSYVDPIFFKIFIYYKKIFRNRFLWIVDTLLKMYYKTPTIYPFVYYPKTFTNVKKIIYNAVGGPRKEDNTHLKYLSFLENVNYLSIRDKFAYLVIKKWVNRSVLTPDSAIIMSDIFKKNVIEKKLMMKQNMPDKFLFFQVNHSYGEKKIRELLKVLESHYRRYGLEIVLCPIGTALGHEDHIILEKIHKELKVPHRYIVSPDIWDIMLLISESNLYIGTSLHGTITAMSFNVPYIGLGKEGSKLDAYLKTWGITKASSITNVENVLIRTEEVINIPRRKYKENSNMQKKKVYDSFMQISNIIKNEK